MARFLFNPIAIVPREKEQSSSNADSIAARGLTQKTPSLLRMSRLASDPGSGCEVDHADDVLLLDARHGHRDEEGPGDFAPDEGNTTSDFECSLILERCIEVRLEAKLSVYAVQTSYLD